MAQFGAALKLAAKAADKLSKEYDKRQKAKNNDSAPQPNTAGGSSRAPPPPVPPKPGNPPSTRPNAGGMSDTAPSFGLTFPDARDALPDFSFAGYKALEAPLPEAHADLPHKWLEPSNNECCRNGDIQAAIDELGRGGGGVCFLRKGEYHLAGGTINLCWPNVIVRGEGDATVILPRGDPRPLFVVGAGPHHPPESKPDGKRAVRIREKYVPIGAQSVTVADTAIFKVGDQIALRRKATEGWIAALGMDKLERDGKQQVWIKPGKAIDQTRTITAIRGNTITFDCPLTDPLDGERFPDSHPSVLLIPPAPDGSLPPVTNSGIEHLKAVFTTSRCGDPIGPTVKLFEIDRATDCWIRSVRTEGFLSTASLGYGARRVTLADCTFVRTAGTHRPEKGGRPLPTDVEIRGSQILLLRCRTEGDRNTECYVVTTQTLTHGPNALHRYVCPRMKKHRLEPHQRWATGILFDECDVGGVSLYNRHIMGSGHGWACGASVAWNCRTKTLAVQDPPGNRNFIVGCTGEYPDPNTATGTIIDKLPGPKSLLRAQLEARKGKEHSDALLGPGDT